MEAFYKEAFVDPDKVIPAGLLGGAVGFGVGRLTAPKPKTLRELLKEHVEKAKGFAKREWKNPDVRAGTALVGGAAGAAGLYTLLKAHADRKRRQSKLGMDKEAFMFGWAGKLIDRLAKATGKAVTKPIHSPVEFSKDVGRGIQNVHHRGVRPAWDVFKRYTGLNTLSEEANLGKLLAKHPQLGQDWQTVSQHLAARGVNPSGGLFHTYFNLPGSLTERLTNTGKMRWFLENYNDPAKLKQLTHGADPATIQALERVMQFKVPTSKVIKDPVKGWTRQTTGDQFLHQRLREKASPSLGISLGVPAALAVPSMLKKDPDEINREVTTSPFRSPFAPKEQPNFIQRGMGAAGDAVSPFSPGLGNFMREHPYASAGIGAAGLGGLGYMGYRAMGGGE
jgi:hypothetical protein